MNYLLIATSVLTFLNLMMLVRPGQRLLERIVSIPFVLWEMFWHWIRPQIGNTYLKSDSKINFGDNPDMNLYRFPINADGQPWTAEKESRMSSRDTNLYRIDTRRRVWRWKNHG